MKKRYLGKQTQKLRNHKCVQNGGEQLHEKEKFTFIAGR